MVLAGEHCVEPFVNGHISEQNTSTAALSVKKLSLSIKTSLSTHASSPTEISPNLNRKMMTLNTTMEKKNKNKVLLKTKKLKRLTMFKLTEIMLSKLIYVIYFNLVLLVDRYVFTLLISFQVLAENHVETQLAITLYLVCKQLLRIVCR